MTTDGAGLAGEFTLDQAPALLAPIAAVYDAMLSEHGATPLGMGWRVAENQRLRFDQLCRLFAPGDEAGGMTVNDLGCGYGAFLDHLSGLGVLAGGHFFGYDICESAIDTARSLHRDGRATFLHSLVPVWRADYSFACGPYNLRFQVEPATWIAWVRRSLRTLADKSRRGFAFNMLRAPGVPGDDDMYYADPDEWAEFCRGAIAPDVTLLQDYRLAEFTILVRLA